MLFLCSHVARPRKYRVISSLLGSLAQHPHENVLNAIALDDTSEVMPIWLPMANGDAENYFATSTCFLGRLRYGVMMSPFPDGTLMR